MVPPLVDLTSQIQFKRGRHFPGKELQGGRRIKGGRRPRKGGQGGPFKCGGKLGNGRGLSFPRSYSPGTGEALERGEAGSPVFPGRRMVGGVEGGGFPKHWNFKRDPWFFEIRIGGFFRFPPRGIRGERVGARVLKFSVLLGWV